MKVEKISYQELYPTGVYANQRPGLEASIEPGEDPVKALMELKELSDRFHRQSNPHLYPNGNEAIITAGPIPEQQVQKDSRESATQRIIDQITQCSDETVLKSFQLIAKNNPEIQEVYDKKLKSFQ